jgi:predicted patatin/cPLA2 family phospholipase
MKTAWIFPGGAARSVYTAGVLYALSEMNVKKPDIIVACSGSAPTSVCYLTNQPEIIKRVWLNSLSTRRFVNFFRFWNIVDVDYLIDYVVRKKNPLDMEKLSHSETLTFFPLTNTKTGEIEYISNKDDVNFWEVIKAAVSVPICTKLSIKGVRVGNQFYSDSPGATRYQLHVAKVLKEGAKRIIVFDNWHDEDNRSSYIFSKLLAFLGNATYRRNQFENLDKIKNFVPPEGVEFIKLTPSKPLNMGRFEIDNTTAQRVFNVGCEDVLAAQPIIDARVRGK